MPLETRGGSKVGPHGDEARPASRQRLCLYVERRDEGFEAAELGSANTSKSRNGHTDSRNHVSKATQARGVANRSHSYADVGRESGGETTRNGDDTQRALKDSKGS